MWFALDSTKCQLGHGSAMTAWQIRRSCRMPRSADLVPCLGSEPLQAVDLVRHDNLHRTNANGLAYGRRCIRGSTWTSSFHSKRAAKTYRGSRLSACCMMNVCDAGHASLNVQEQGSASRLQWLPFSPRVQTQSPRKISGPGTRLTSRFRSTKMTPMSLRQTTDARESLQPSRLYSRNRPKRSQRDLSSALEHEGRRNRQWLRQSRQLQLRALLLSPRHLRRNPRAPTRATFPHSCSLS